MSAAAQFKGSIAMRGDLSIVVRDALTKEAIKHIEIRNKITFLAADLLVELLAQRTTDSQPISVALPTPHYEHPNEIFSMRMGTSSVPAERTDTNLGAFVHGVLLEDVSKITGVPGELQFVAQLGVGDANGNTLQEAGLFTRGDAGAGLATASDLPQTIPGKVRMFARQGHAPVSKTAAITVEYSWRVALTA